MPFMPTASLLQQGYIPWIDAGPPSDRATLQAVLNSVPASGAIVLLRPGTTYPVKTTTTYTSALVPKENTMILGGPGSKILADPTSAIGIILVALFEDNTTVEGVEFDQSSITDSVAVSIGSCSFGTVARNTFRNIGATGVNLLNGAYDLSVEGNKMVGPGYGVLTNSPAAAGRWRIVGNRMVGGASGDGIELNNPSGAITDILISDNVISGYTSTTTSGIGIGVAGLGSTAIVISNNVVTGCGLDGIHVEDGVRDVTIIGNQVDTTGRAGISVQCSSAARQTKEITVSGNVVVGCGYDAGASGVAFEGAQGIFDYTCVGNIVIGSSKAAAANGYGIDLGYQPQGVVCAGNVVKNTKGIVSAGIVVNQGTDMLVVGNRCTDDQGVKTQQYGIRTAGTLTDVTISSNNLDGNLTAAILDGGSGTRYWKLMNNGITPVSVSGSRAGNAALASLLTALAGVGVITDGTSA